MYFDLANIWSPDKLCAWSVFQGVPTSWNKCLKIFTNSKRYNINVSSTFDFQEGRDVRLSCRRGAAETRVYCLRIEGPTVPGLRIHKDQQEASIERNRAISRLPSILPVSPSRYVHSRIFTARRYVKRRHSGSTPVSSSDFLSLIRYIRNDCYTDSELPQRVRDTRDFFFPSRGC